MATPLQKGWIGVDLDGTLAVYQGWQGITEIGAPIPKMVARVRQWRTDGVEVRIVTARVGPQSREVEELAATLSAIQQWCLTHIGEVLPVTNAKDFGMLELWDDRAVQVIQNTGERVDEIANQEPSTKNQEPPSVRILMLNRRWTHGAPEGGLQGYSGKRWTMASSRYLPQYACHGIEISLEEYEACREDIFKAAQLSGRTWEPVVLVDSGKLIVDSQSPAPAAAQYAPEGPAPAGSPSPSAPPLPPPKATEVAIGVPIDIETANYSTLKAFAKQKGFPLPPNVKNAASARKHIRAAQAGPAQKAA